MTNFGDLLPAALGVALSPLPIIGAIVICVTGRAKSLGWPYIFGWMASIIALGYLGTFINWIFSKLGDSASTVQAVVQIGLGIFMLWFAWKNWKERPEPGEVLPTPDWIAGIATMSGKDAFLMSFVIGILNAKNIPIVLSATTMLSQMPQSAGSHTLYILLFVLVGSILVALPLLLTALMGEKIQPALERADAWLQHNNNAIMAVLFAFLGLSALGSGLDTFLSA